VGQVVSLAVVGPIAFAISMGVIRWTQPATYAELRSLAGFRKVRDAAGRALGRIVRRG
jgi:hypothetical protein